MNKKIELKKLQEGCNKEINGDGDCWYISSQGNKRYCSSCKRKIDKLKKEINFSGGR